jgi:hypothetical protein
MNRGLRTAHILAQLKIPQQLSIKEFQATGGLDDLFLRIRRNHFAAVITPSIDPGVLQCFLDLYDPLSALCPTAGDLSRPNLLVLQAER